MRQPQSTSQYRELLKLFRARFFESDALAEGSGYSTNVIQMSSILISIGIAAAFITIGPLISFSFNKSPDAQWALRQFRLFHASYSFAVTGFATIFQWDMLFPDRRDFMVLTPFPIRLRELFAAKMASLGIFLGILAAAVNGASVVVFCFFAILTAYGRSLALLKVLLMHATTVCLASAFAFLAVATLQGVLINITTPSFFKRISPHFQMAGMSVMVMVLFLYPLDSNILFIATFHRDWLWYFPPYWFMAVQELFLPHPDPVFRAVGLFGLKSVAAALILFCAVWSAGFARHYRRTLEAEDTGSALRGGKRWFDAFLRSPQERGIFYFTGATLARSTPHRLFLATWISVGLSLGTLVMVGVGTDGFVVSAEGARAFPILVTFFLISGFRACFQFPAELPSNWPFRIAESGWGRAARDAARKRVLVSGLLPAVLVFLPFELARWGWQAGLQHAVFQLACGALLTEVLFWTFDKVPFTCSYFPGKMNLALLGVIYLYGFTGYSFTMSDLEASLEFNVGRSVLFFAAASLALTGLWMRRSPGDPVLFDGSEPEIRTLDLWH